MRKAMEDQAIEEVKPRGPHKKTQELEERIAALESNLDKLTDAVRQMGHIMGWPKDIMTNCGIKPFDVKTEKIKVNGR